MFYHYIEDIKKFLINQHCYECNSKNTEPFTYICSTCIDKMELMKNLPATCPLCYDHPITTNVCPNCTDTQAIWSKLHIIYSYKNKAVKNLVHWYKFKNSVLAEKDLVKLLEPNLRIFQNHHCVVVPCSNNTKQRLGFNPVTKILQHLNMEYSESLQKTNNIMVKKLNKHQRQHLTGILSLTPRMIPTDKKILLVDDIFTTGTTLTIAAQELYRHNITNFEALCFFRS